jgi:threonine aldolase
MGEACRERESSRSSEGWQTEQVKLHDDTYRSFASDNYAGAHPEILVAIANANGGHQVAYGEDVYTAKLQEVMKHHFGERTETFPVFNGTGANVTPTRMAPRNVSAVSNC